jgi:hypothetical protein
MLAERRPDIVAKRAVKKSQPTCWHAATMWKPVRRLLKTKVASNMKNSVEYVVGRNYYECKRLGSGEYNQQCGKYSDGFRCVRCRASVPYLP